MTETGNDAKKREMLADIVREMRGANFQPPWYQTKIDAYADRIEAAWKRQMSQSWHHREMEELVLRHEKEVAELKKQTGNAAALRESVIKALTLLNVCDWPSGVSLDGVGEVIHEIDSALDKPPRNCDLPLVVDGPATKNADKAWIVFKERNPNAYFDVLGLLRCIEWLLAPAAERKGENK